MKKYFVLLCVGFLALSCGSKNSTTSASGSNNSSSSFSWNGPLVLSEISDLYNSPIAWTEIATSNGPVNNASVTLSYSGTSVALPYVTSYTASVTYNGAVTTISASYYDTSSFTYTGGQSYTLTAKISGTTYSATTTAVGLPTFSVSGSNLVCTWSGGGNENLITVSETVSPYTSKIYGPSSLASPYNIAISSLPGGSGQNSILASINNLNTSAFSNTTTGSYFVAASEAVTTY